MNGNASRFAKGSGCYKCECCGKSTRATGRGDNEHARLCAPCYDLGGLENLHSDNGHPGGLLDCPTCGAEARALVADGARL